MMIITFVLDLLSRIADAKFPHLVLKLIRGVVSVVRVLPNPLALALNQAKKTNSP